MTTEPFIDAANARRHREKNRSLSNPYYDKQANKVAQWPLGQPRPLDIRVRELPFVICNAKATNSH